MQLYYPWKFKKEKKNSNNLLYYNIYVCATQRPPLVKKL